MDYENEQAQGDVIEQEEVGTSGEEIDIPFEEETITIAKSKFTKMQRKAIAYDAKKPSKQLITEKVVDDSLHKDIQSLKQAEQKRQFGYQNNLSPEEVDAVFKLNPTPTQETLKDPFVSGGLEKIRSQKRVESNTPQPSGSNFVSNGKTWNDMDDNEKQVNYPAYIQAISKARRG